MSELQQTIGRVALTCKLMDDLDRQAAKRSGAFGQMDVPEYAFRTMVNGVRVVIFVGEEDEEGDVMGSILAALDEAAS